MKKYIYTIFYIIFFNSFAISETKINPIQEGNPDAKIKLIVYESLTCSHCADFHKKVYPDLKKEFIDKGIVKIEFRNFPLDMAALNGSKIAHCKNDGKPNILHFLFNNQNMWVKGETVDELNLNLEKIINKENFGINVKNCLNNKKVEDHILEDRIDAVKKFKVNSTPTIIINDKKFEKPLNFKNLKKSIEKLI
tara:strand:+ start:527 stop:1108 length:582 start_codon:yes stop_codon:yes gene_type:complete